MKTIRIATILLAAAMVALAACQSLFFSSKPAPATEVSLPPTATVTPTPLPTPTPEARKRKRRRHGRTPTPGPSVTPSASMPSASMPSAPIQVEQTPAAAATVITTGESAAEHRDIENGLHQVEQRLAPIKREKLNPQDAEDYDRIKSFVAEARSALDEQDDLRARSLIEKASRLTTELSGRVSTP